AAEFPPVSREDWLKLVEKTLKGADFDKKLVSKSYDGLKIQPLYERAKGAAPIAGRAAGQPWRVMARIDLPDAKAANKEALHELENGASALALIFAGAPAANGYGLADVSVEALAQVLDNVWLDAVAIRLDPRGRGFAAMKNFLALAEQRGTALEKLDVSFAIDPMGALAALGSTPQPPEATIAKRAEFAADLSKRGFRGQVFMADGRPVHDAGGSEAQELAYVLSCAVTYWRALEAAGLSLDAGRKQIAFLLSADADQFLTTAKFRALRKLWTRIEEAAKIPPAPIKLHAETAWRMMTRYEPSVNWLRETVAVFAAGTGGADTITALPHTAALGLPDRFSRRMARNLQLILLEESNLYRVGDPNAGSGAIETLTDELCAAAWKIFQEIEAQGGTAKALLSGSIQNKVEEVRKTREKNIATRKDALTGTSEFPNLGEPSPAVLDVAKPPFPLQKPAVHSKTLPRIRLAEPFEALRDAAARGGTPRVFLANLGTPADFTARASFANNFFESGGVTAKSNDGFASASDAASAFKKSGASIACLCSSDEIYAREAEAAARALKQAGAKAIYLAGRPGEHEAAFKKAGVDGFIFAGSDVLAALQQIHATLGLK
ncbi:MAG TPA: methylmalonyl-CoA mutase family protein, partial [Xanthobacteraceae bacterium]|nr:methylmalonyl-CoA mutase family protein [Xanthobacteraceae bacterium]